MSENCKSEKESYQQALSDLEAKGIVSNLYTIEIRSLGHWLHASQKPLLNVAPLATKQIARSWTRQPARSLEPLKPFLRHKLTKRGCHHMLYSENHNFLITS